MKDLWAKYGTNFKADGAQSTQEWWSNKPQVADPKQDLYREIYADLVKTGPLAPADQTRLDNAWRKGGLDRATDVAYKLIVERDMADEKEWFYRIFYV